MSSLTTSAAILQLEETLIILEESLKQPLVDLADSKNHILRLKQFYSPLFDFEHSESGSYYHAALRCIKATYLDDDANCKLSFSPIFVNSISCMLKLNTLALDTKHNKNGITESLLELAELWNLQQSHDMAELLVNIINGMRAEVTLLLNDEIH